MKKTLSIFLAFIMLISCFSVLSVSAETGDLSDVLYSEESIATSNSALKKFTVNNLPAQFDFKFEERDDGANAKVWKDVDLLGIDLDFLYSGDSTLIWSELDVYQKDANGNIIYDLNKNPIVAISRDDISLAFTNINIYLQRVVYKQYGGLKLYNVNNAVALANLIGKALKPDFKTLDVNNYKNYFTNEIPSANEFFDAVTTLSGLGEIVSQNWIPRGRNFSEPVVKLLGGDYINFVSEYYTDGHRLASKTLEAMVSKILTVGPVDFAYELLNAFTSDSYALAYREPILALFSFKIAGLSEYITESKLNSFDGLLHLILCTCDPIAGEGCYADSSDVSHFCAFDFPVARFRNTTDKDEKLMYLYYYLNLSGRYKNNGNYIRGLKNSISRNVSLSSEDQIKLSALVDGFLLGDFESAIDNAIIPLYKENISTAGDSLFDRFRNAFMVFMKKIADFFDYLRKIFSGELQYGQGNSPFN